MPPVTNRVPSLCQEQDVRESSGECDNLTLSSSVSMFHNQSSGQSSGPQAIKWEPSGDQARKATPYECPSKVLRWVQVRVSLKENLKYIVSNKRIKNWLYKFNKSSFYK